MHKRLSIVFAASIASSLLCFSSAGAERRIFVDPGSIVAVESGDFILEIAVNDTVRGLMGYDIRVRYDPSYLEPIDVAEGSLPAGSGHDTFFQKMNPACACDSIQVNGAVLGNTVDGPGALAAVRFRALRVGSTWVAVSKASALRSGENDRLSFGIGGGLVRIDREVGAEKSSWGALKYLFAIYY